MALSLAEEVALLPAAQARKIIVSIPPEELAYDWSFWGRPEQQEPAGDWDFWLVNAGRGFGKTISGAEWCRKEAARLPRTRGALIGPTAADVRDVMIEGESGILARSPPEFMPDYQPSKRRLVWPNGTMAFCYSAEEPQRLRGPQHHWFWGDELAAWKYQETWDQLMFGLRLGDKPRGLVTTTPRPIPRIRELLKDPRCVVTTGTTYDNAANLAPTFITNLIQKYEGTRLGRQELRAELLDDTPGALWTLAMIDAGRVEEAPELQRIAVGCDPAAGHGPDSDDTGLIVAGLGVDGHGYVLADGTCHLPPLGWGGRAVNLYHQFDANAIVAEVNQGGEMVTSNIHTVDPLVNVQTVRASKGKAARAEPVSSLYEQGRVHHVGHLGALEDQLTTYVPGPGAASPDRLDALVWVITWLMLGDDAAPRVRRL